MRERTKPHGFEMDESYRTHQRCPECERRFEVVQCRYWERKWAGENVAPRTRVFCSNACKQRAYRKRLAVGLHNVTGGTGLTGLRD
jgi:hypothetical protein